MLVVYLTDLTIVINTVITEYYQTIKQYSGSYCNFMIFLKYMILATYLWIIVHLVRLAPNIECQINMCDPSKISFIDISQVIVLTFGKRPENIDATAQEALAYLSETCKMFQNIIRKLKGTNEDTAQVVSSNLSEPNLIRVLGN